MVNEMNRQIHKIRPRLLAWLHRSRSAVRLNCGRKLRIGSTNFEHCPTSFIKQFPYKDIKQATGGFQRVLYGDSRGTAYVARFKDGGIVLVKDHNQENDVFFKEVDLLGCLHHRHLLTLKGFSIGRKRLLVFDNIENGSLKEHLNDPLKTPLNWKTRSQIAIDVAAALEYLLFFCNLPVYHISISSSSIMLDENFTAKLSNIGLISSVGNCTTTRASNREDCINQSCGNLIFQLGVLILELVTGQSSEGGHSDLVQWIQGSCFRSSMQKMIDPDLGTSYDSRELRNLLAVARLCINSSDNPKFSVPHIFRYLQKR